MAGVEDRVVIVTGAGGGLGRQHALLLAEHGAKVVVNDVGEGRQGTRAGRDMADKVVQEIVNVGGEAVANYHSVATAEGGEAIVGTALEAYGRIDAVVNNAGILRDVTFAKMTAEQWDAVLRVHLYGAYHVTRAAWPHFRQQSFGRVVVTTSTSGLYGNFGQANYATAKMGLVGFMNTLAVEGAKYHITANAVVPLAATRMTEDLMPAEMLDTLDPAFASPAVVRLAGDDCTSTGEVILAFGGRYARVKVMESPGVRFDHVPSVEELADAWDDILDLSGAEPGRNPLA